MSEMVYRTELRFNAIYVIESLRPGDRKTGEELYDSIIFPRTRGLEGCYTKYRKVEDEGQLRSALREIATVCREANHLPPAYERLRKTFLMLDLFPENEERFGLTYDLCIKDTSRP